MGDAAALLPRRPEAILFDFDGVILDSAELKTAAFASIYEDEEPAKIAAVVAYQRYHGGVNRLAKFAYFETEIFGRDATHQRLEELSAAFTDISYDSVLAAPFVDGAVEFLQAARRKAAMYLVSGTPQQELQSIVVKRGLSRFFDEVIGAPELKRDAFAFLLRSGAHPPGRALAIGDAITECEAALALGVPFLGVVAAGAEATFPHSIPVVRNLVGLANLLGFT